MLQVRWDGGNAEAAGVYGMPMLGGAVGTRALARARPFPASTAPGLRVACERIRFSFAVSYVAGWAVLLDFTTAAVGIRLPGFVGGASLVCTTVCWLLEAAGGLAMWRTVPTSCSSCPLVHGRLVENLVVAVGDKVIGVVGLSSYVCLVSGGVYISGQEKFVFGLLVV